MTPRLNCLKPMNNIVVFPGSFNPITTAHTSIISNIINTLEDSLGIVLPVGNNYNKEELIDFSHRFNMITLALRNHTNVIVSDFENQEVQPKTIMSLNHFYKIYKTNIYLVIGSDNLATFDKWYQAEELLKNYNIIVINRLDDIDNIIKSSNLLSKYSNKINIFTDNKYPYISSSNVRKQYNLHKSDIDPLVHKYIKENKLYTK